MDVLFLLALGGGSWFALRRGHFLVVAFLLIVLGVYLGAAIPGSNGLVIAIRSGVHGLANGVVAAIHAAGGGA